jgi:hypothetical protein
MNDTEMVVQAELRKEALVMEEGEEQLQGPGWWHGLHGMSVLRGNMAPRERDSITGQLILCLYACTMTAR